MPGRRTSRMTASGRSLAGELEGGLGGRGDADLVALPLERLAQGPGDGLFVVDNEMCWRAWCQAGGKTRAGSSVFS